MPPSQSMVTAGVDRPTTSGLFCRSVQDGSIAVVVRCQPPRQYRVGGGGEKKRTLTTGRWVGNGGCSKEFVFVACRARWTGWYEFGGVCCCSIESVLFKQLKGQGQTRTTISKSGKTSAWGSTAACKRVWPRLHRGCGGRSCQCCSPMGKERLTVLAQPLIGWTSGRRSATPHLTPKCLRLLLHHAVSSFDIATSIPSLVPQSSLPSHAASTTRVASGRVQDGRNNLFRIEKAMISDLCKPRALPPQPHMPP